MRQKQCKANGDCHSWTDPDVTVLNAINIIKNKPNGTVYLYRMVQVIEIKLYLFNHKIRHRIIHKNGVWTVKFDKNIKIKNTG